MFLRVQLIVSMLLAIKNFTLELARAHGRSHFILFSVKSAREKNDTCYSSINSSSVSGPILKIPFSVAPYKYLGRPQFV